MVVLFGCRVGIQVCCGVLCSWRDPPPRLKGSWPSRVEGSCVLSGGGESPLWAVLFSRAARPECPPQGPSPARLGARWGSISVRRGRILERLAFSEPGRWDYSKYEVLSKKFSKTKKFFFWRWFFIWKKKFFF